jgi:hypothetical protein
MKKHTSKMHYLWDCKEEGTSTKCIIYEIAKKRVQAQNALSMRLQRRGVQAQQFIACKPKYVCPS